MGHDLERCSLRAAADCRDSGRARNTCPVSNVASPPWSCDVFAATCTVPDPDAAHTCDTSRKGRSNRPIANALRWSSEMFPVKSVVADTGSADFVAQNTVIVQSSAETVHHSAIVDAGSADVALTETVTDPNCAECVLHGAVVDPDCIGAVPQSTVADPGCAHIITAVDLCTAHPTSADLASDCAVVPLTTAAHDIAEDDVEFRLLPTSRILRLSRNNNPAAYDKSAAALAPERDQHFVHVLMAEHPLMGPTQALLFRMVCFLRSCDYDDTDLRSMLVSASCYMDDAQVHLKADEMTECFVLFVFLAHCYTQDECCPLFYWHRSLFQEYCTVPALNQGLFRLQKQRGFVLRVDDGVYRKKDMRFPR